MSINTSQEETDSRYYPMLAFEDPSAKEDLHAAWVVYRALPKETREVLLASSMPTKLRLLCEVFHVKDADIVKVSSAIRDMFFKKKTLEKTATIIAMMASADQAKVTDFIQREILTVKPDPEVVEEADEMTGTAGPSRDSLALLAALGKYPRIGEQMISREKIHVKGQNDPVRPNILNWLKVYRDELGVGYHDPVRRAKFLFQSPSCKGLSSEERERLNLLLRSIEENVPLEIDVARAEIIFPSFNVVEGLPAKLSSRTQSSVPLGNSLPIDRQVPHSRQGGVDQSDRKEELTPPLAPKRKDVPVAPTPSHPIVGKGSGFRMTRGMGFHTLEPREVSANPVETKDAIAKNVNTEAGITFSSKHAFPAEQGGFGIKKDLSGQLPSGTIFRGSPPLSRARESKDLNSGKDVGKKAEKPNPFSIKPMSMIEREKSGGSGDDMGRIVDLRNEE